MNPPRYLFLVTTLIPIPQEKSSARATFRGATTNIILVGSVKYFLGRPRACKSQRYASNVHEPSSSPRIIRVTRLCYAGVCSPKLPYEGEDPYVIGYHGEGVPLGHALLAVREFA